MVNLTAAFIVALFFFAFFFLIAIAIKYKDIDKIVFFEQLRIDKENQTSKNEIIENSTMHPTALPTTVPTMHPTFVPTTVPTMHPTMHPTTVPIEAEIEIINETVPATEYPTMHPTEFPTEPVDEIVYTESPVIITSPSKLPEDYHYQVIETETTEQFI